MVYSGDKWFILGINGLFWEYMVYSGDELCILGIEWFILGNGWLILGIYSRDTWFILGINGLCWEINGLFWG